MRWGFKAQARDTAAGVRAELGLSPLDARDPWALAEGLDIPIELLTSFKNASASIAVLLGAEASSFSAVTVLDGTARMIVVNDKHSRGRQASSIAHEIGHALLLHPQTPPFDERGLRRVKSELEEEAAFLGGVLLVTDEMTLHIVRNQTPMDLAAASLGVSVPLVRMRVNQAGAVKRVERRAGHAKR